MSKKTLVTGVYGFIGRHVARRMTGHGWQVIGLGHGSWVNKEWQPVVDLKTGIRDYACWVRGRAL